MNISENVQQLLKDVAEGNCFHESVTVVAATKMQTAEAINEAIQAGISDVGENWVQEFKEKYDLVNGGNRHFIGHLQTNKVKYLIGKTYLYHSCDRMDLAEELSKRSQKNNLTSDVLIQINIGCEESKGGFEYEDGFTAYEKIRNMPGIRVCGFMAMLPMQGEEEYLLSLVKKMRNLYDTAKAQDENIKFLSMGMSGDYKLCLKGGSNMIRVGTTIFGERNYN
ncbi:MAG: YggS family pyridoxal phosphate-dependent enzyme [Clostridia bacterium]|nr:YggS family pyridoxal phosphate-dependent enzyme [Clostridia bacterium]